MVSRHRAHRPVRDARFEAPACQPHFKRLGFRVGLDDFLQQTALDAEADRVRRRVPHAPLPAPLGGLERCE
jgi:hypothetical protein